MGEDGHRYVFGQWPEAPWKQDEDFAQDDDDLEVGGHDGHPVADDDTAKTGTQSAA